MLLSDSINGAIEKKKILKFMEDNYLEIRDRIVEYIIFNVDLNRNDVLEILSDYVNELFNMYDKSKYKNYIRITNKEYFDYLYNNWTGLEEDRIIQIVEDFLEVTIASEKAMPIFNVYRDTMRYIAEMMYNGKKPKINKIKSILEEKDLSMIPAKK